MFVIILALRRYQFVSDGSPKMLKITIIACRADIRNESMAGMTKKKNYMIGRVLLVLLTLIGFDSAYWLLFFIWRSAAEPANNALWLPRIHGWLACSIITGLAWVVLLVWMLRGKRRSI
jgi:hypothetical protein